MIVLTGYLATWKWSGVATTLLFSPRSVFFLIAQPCWERLNDPSFMFLPWTLISVLSHLMEDVTVSINEPIIHIFARAWTIVGLHSSRVSFSSFIFTNICLCQPHKWSLSAVFLLDGWCLFFLSLFWNPSWVFSLWFPRYLLVTAGEDRYVKTWDLRRPYNPITALKRCLTNEIYWPLNAAGFMLAQDNSYASLVGFFLVSTRITTGKVCGDIVLTG